MSITREQIIRVEKLASLKIDESKIDEMTEGLLKVFSWVDQLKKMDISNTEPLSNPVVDIIPHTPLREDIPHQDNSTEDVLSNAPEQNYGFFLVPKVVE